MSEVPDWVVDDYVKADCACGHRRSSHSMVDGGCTQTVNTIDYEALPTPIYVEDFGFDPPTNWPEVLPRVDKTCPCKHFADPEPSEPDFDRYSAGEW